MTAAISEALLSSLKIDKGQSCLRQAHCNTCRRITESCKKQLNNLRKALHIWNAQILYISEEISAEAMFYVEQHFLGNAMQLADALIGAAAIAYGNPVLTGNDKHYKVLKDLEIKRFRP